MTYHYIFKEGKSEKEPVFVLLHGTGGDEYSLLSLMERIAPDAAVLSLRGNRNENGMNRFFNRYPDGRIDVTDLINETDTLYQFLTELGKSHGFSERTMVAIGYSNGANMIISHFYHSNPIFKGALLFHGMDYRSTDHLPDLKGISIFAAVGLNDPLVSQESTKKMIAKFKKNGADVQDYWSTSGHQLTDNEISAAQKWVKSFDEGQSDMKTLLKKINRFARLSRERELTQKELNTQRELRDHYLSIFRGSLKQHLLSVKLFDDKGNDVTPHKVKVIQSNLDKRKDKKLVDTLTNKMEEVKVMHQLLGIHHVSMVTSDAKKNVAFYTKVLGMRMVKKTVNQDDVSVYHLFYADKKGSPGTDLTFFEFPGTMATKKGTNSISRVSLRVPSDQSLDFWSNRFDELGVTYDKISTLFGHKILEFDDFDGTPMRLVSDEKNKGVSGGIPWGNGPIPIEHAIYGLGPVTLTVSRLDLIRTFLNDVLHFREVAQERDLILFEVGEGGHGAQVIVQEDAAHSPEQPGYGSVHHVAFRVADRDALNEWIKIMNQTGLPNSGFVDRFYFQSLYVREYNHILFEFATDGPGFATDEDEDVLGQRLSLPPFLEDKRVFIEQRLEPLND